MPINIRKQMEFFRIIINAVTISVLKLLATHFQLFNKGNNIRAAFYNICIANHTIVSPTSQPVTYTEQDLA